MEPWVLGLGESPSATPDARGERDLVGVLPGSRPGGGWPVSRSSPHRSGSPLRPGACHENLLFRVCRAMGSRTAPPPPESSGHSGWRPLRWAQHRPVRAVVMDVAVWVGPRPAGGSGEATGLRLPRWPWAWVVDSEDGQARPGPRPAPQLWGPGAPPPGTQPCLPRGADDSQRAGRQRPLSVSGHRPVPAALRLPTRPSFPGGRGALLSHTVGTGGPSCTVL